MFFPAFWLIDIFIHFSDISSTITHIWKNKTQKKILALFSISFCIQNNIDLEHFFILNSPTIILISFPSMQIRKVSKAAFYRLSLSWLFPTGRTQIKYSCARRSVALKAKKYSCARRSVALKANSMLSSFSKANLWKMSNRQLSIRIDFILLFLFHRATEP